MALAGRLLQPRAVEHRQPAAHVPHDPRSTVTRFAHERRAAGAAVERVVPEVRTFVREAASCEGWHDPADALLAQVVRWAVTAYHDEPELALVPRFH